MIKKCLIRTLENILDFLDRVLSSVIYLIIFIIASYAAYSAWDEGEVYVRAVKVKKETEQYKPEITEEEKPDFSELISLNPDVKGWITIYDTKIDYPLLQTDSNFTYLNKDVFGNQALAGSIFLDYRNSSDLSDVFTLIYGHYMNGDEMFGSLTKFKTRDFFDAHKDGIIMTPDKVYKLSIFAVMVISSSDSYVFKPEIMDKQRISELLDKIIDSAVFYDAEKISEYKNDMDNYKIIALSTCSYEFTGARTVVFCLAEEDIP